MGVFVTPLALWSSAQFPRRNGQLCDAKRPCVHWVRSTHSRQVRLCHIARRSSSFRGLFGQSPGESHSRDRKSATLFVVVVVVICSRCVVCRRLLVRDERTDVAD